MIRVASSEVKWVICVTIWDRRICRHLLEREGFVEDCSPAGIMPDLRLELLLVLRVRANNEFNVRVRLVHEARCI